MELTAQALDWLIQVSAFVRLEAGPPAIVRVIVQDPVDAAQRVEAWRLVVDDVTTEVALLGAVQDAQGMVREGQAGGRFQFLDASERGWQGSVFRG